MPILLVLLGERTKVISIFLLRFLFPMTLVIADSVKIVISFFRANHRNLKLVVFLSLTDINMAAYDDKAASIDGNEDLKKQQSVNR